MANRHMTRCSMSLKLQGNITHVRMAIIKNTKITRVGEDVEKNKATSPYTVGRNVNWHSYCGKQYGGSSKH